MLDKEKKGRGAQPTGERNNKAKLTKEQVIQIRSIASTRTRKSIGEMFGVTDANICGIVNRKTWRHI